AEPVRVLAPVAGSGKMPRFGTATGVFGRGGVVLDGRGVAAADVDNDGRMDIAINTIGGRLVLLRPAGPVGPWRGVEPDTFSPGATVTAVLPDGERFVGAVQAGG